MRKRKICLPNYSPETAQPDERIIIKSFPKLSDLIAFAFSSKARHNKVLMEQILSIQSTVTIGFVGNNVAGPVITHLGHQPLLVNTVALAAHPGYGLFAGGPMPDATFNAILRALSTLED